MKTLRLWKIINPIHLNSNFPRRTRKRINILKLKNPSIKVWIGVLIWRIKDLTSFTAKSTVEDLEPSQHLRWSSLRQQSTAWNFQALLTTAPTQHLRSPGNTSRLSIDIIFHDKNLSLKYIQNRPIKKQSRIYNISSSEIITVIIIQLTLSNSNLYYSNLSIIRTNSKSPSILLKKLL